MSPNPPLPATLSLLSPLTPPSLERTWLTSPHPRLPLVATCSADKTVRIYSLQNFNLLSTITGGHKRSVRSCAWKPLVKGESVLATGSFDATVGVWRRWDGYGNEIDGINGDYAGGNMEVNVNGEGEVGGEGGGESDEDEEWRFAVLLDGHDSEVKSLAWSPAGSLLATCSRDKSIWIWEDLDDGDNNFETVAVMQEHSGDVKWVSWHPSEECLASGSYDDTIRLWREDVDDWGQVACLRGHAGTVWCVEWEGEGESTIPTANAEAGSSDGASEDETTRRNNTWLERHNQTGPRLVSCSDDRTIRIWTKQPRPRANPHASSSTGPGAIPSIIRPASIDETWSESAQLPGRHDLSVYSVAWSKRSGLIASTGADGRIVVYQERFVEEPPAAATTTEAKTDVDAHMDGADGDADGNGQVQAEEQPSLPRTEWHVIAIFDAAHGIYEVNHICWAPRVDRGRKEGEEEEVLVSTGDDGCVKVWRLER
ncbi:hypothetical protein AJ79_01421 [Helicocarpus griseus UAMH5409]|uniref:Probable cytosolic iron-sulfur protein assembly protein 1 n=1 Tax=Helicocarpus griseus UAMH5409 TaxID=1447875 RepID=A0A2B7Y8U9_9EURO|nr:hypothetical protein AJ79_01421 [Helicocarpus griseus UAMH5409]